MEAQFPHLFGNQYAVYAEVVSWLGRCVPSDHVTREAVQACSVHYRPS